MRRTTIFVSVSCAAILATLMVVRSRRSASVRETPIVLAADVPLQVSELDGGSVITDLGYKIKLNDGSSLHRRWYVLNDPSAPVALAAAGIKTSYHSESYGGEYRFLPVGAVTPNVPIQAVQTRILVFDLWGEHLKTLSATEIKDFAAGTPIDLSKTGSWRSYENEVSETLTVISFVAAVRRTDGTTWFFDAKRVLGEVQRIKLKLTESDLAPQKEKPPK